MTSKGKNQSFSRSINIELIINSLIDHSCSGTELAENLGLSNATVSSIIKELNDIGIIRVSETTSTTGLGRKRVNYEINPEYGLILGVNISNLHASISLINTKQEEIICSDLKVEKYDTNTMYQLVLEASKLLINETAIPLKVIVISLPGRVNAVTGELLLSKQFDKELFKEKHFIQNLFAKQFKNIPIILANDNNVMTVGELNHGVLKDCNNGLYFNIDYGIGGGIIINGKPYVGDLGYAGEFGLVKYYNGKDYLPIDEFASLRALCLEASKILNRDITREQLIAEYERNSQIKELVLDSTSIVAETITRLADILDISKTVISGRVTNFGKEYLDKLKKECPSNIHDMDISFSTLGNKAVIYGTSSLGLGIMIDVIKKKYK